MEIKVSNGAVRIDTFLASETEYSRSRLSKFIKEGQVLVNGKTISSSFKVKEGDVVWFNDVQDEEIDVTAEKMDIDIVYEDDYLAVINKKSGIVVHPAVGNYSHTLVNGLMYHFNNISKGGTIRPGIVHRLDKDTSGLMVVAKNDLVHDKLSNMIKEKQVERKYLALVWGTIKHEKGTIDAPIGRDLNNRQKYTVTDINSKDSVTHFKVLERFKDVTLIECKLDTGRTHQIRVHMEYIGHPVVNDPVYGKRKIINNFGQMLHSKNIRFVHPVTLEELFFEVDPPEEFNQILESFK